MGDAGYPGVSDFYIYEPLQLFMLRRLLFYMLQNNFPCKYYMRFCKKIEIELRVCFIILHHQLKP